MIDESGKKGKGGGGSGHEGGAQKGGKTNTKDNTNLNMGGKSDKSVEKNSMDHVKKKQVARGKGVEGRQKSWQGGMGRILGVENAAHKTNKKRGGMTRGNVR